MDLNLLVHLVLLEKKRHQSLWATGITQPAMSNILRRLRKLFNDPLLICSSEGMTPTERALELQPRVRELLADLTQLLEPRTEFRPYTPKSCVSDYDVRLCQTTLVPRLVKALRSEAPNVIFGLLTPSDVSYRDMEQGRVDLAINRFNEVPQSFPKCWFGVILLVVCCRLIVRMSIALT